MKAYVYANKEVTYGEYGWIYLFLPGICSQTDLTIELVEYVNYVQFEYSRSALRKHREAFRKCDLALIPDEIYKNVEALLIDGKDNSDEISQILEEVIEAVEVMEKF